MQPVLWKMGLVSITPRLKECQVLQMLDLMQGTNKGMDLDLVFASELA
jgi:hypothetical protein